MIEAVLLGTGGMLPLPNRWLSSLLIRVNGQLTLFDCGEGTQIAWRKVGWGFRRLGTICISHTHADHIAGLPGLLHAVANAGRVEPVELFGPYGTADVVRGLRTIAPVLPFPIAVTELPGGQQFSLPGGLEASCEAGEHALPVLAFRVDLRRGRAFLPDRARDLGVPVHLWQRLQRGESATWNGRVVSPDDVLGPDRRGLALAYVTDTRPTPAMSTFVSGVDLLVCEGTYGSDDDQAKAERNTHMTFREAATLARDAGVRRLWISHFSPALEEPQAFAANATEVFPETTIGRDGLTVGLTYPED
ncbi:MAG: ribonuclease Z [Thermomicrobiales bacterium]